MFRHSVFGVRLDCDFPLPDLPETDVSDGPVWRVETRTTSAPTWSSAPMGSEVVQGDVVVRAYASPPDALRLQFDDTGTFDVHVADRVIAWYPGPQATDAALRADLLGRVMALAAHADGRLTLHASAVSIGGQGIAFLGPKHAGKSTMALALVRCGARLVADDAVVVRLEGVSGAWAAVGVQRPRLWGDSVRALRIAAGSSDGEKPTLELPADRLERTEVPLRACYLLSPGSPDAGVPVRSHRLSRVHAALSLVRYAKLGALLGGAEAPVVLDRAGALAESVPTYSVDIVRDLRRLDDAAAQFLDWLGAAAMPNATPTT